MLVGIFGCKNPAANQTTAFCNIQLGCDLRDECLLQAKMILTVLSHNFVDFFPASNFRPGQVFHVGGIDVFRERQGAAPRNDQCFALSNRSIDTKGTGGGDSVILDVAHAEPEPWYDPL